MSKHRLQVLAPGKRCVGRNADGSKRFIDFTPEYCRGQFERNQALIQAGIPVPACWEHRSDAKPGQLSLDDWKSARAKGTAGHVEHYELDSANRVFAQVEIPDEADAKLAHKVRFCSPEINQFTDGDGKDWGEVFTHIALTPRPVQHDQPPIARLSLTGPIRLAVDSETGDDMADDKAPETPQVDEKIKGVIEALRDIGMNIPDEVVDADGLIIAIKAANSPDDGDDLDAGTGGDELPPNVCPTNQTPPIGLSHNSTGAEKLAYDRIAVVERKDLVRRVERLVKSGLAPVVANKIKAEIGKAQLSFGTDGNMVPNAVTIKLEALEEAQRAGGWSPKGKRTRLSHVGVADNPHKDDASPEETLSAWDKT